MDYGFVFMIAFLLTGCGGRTHSGNADWAEVKEVDFEGDEEFTDMPVNYVYLFKGTIGEKYEIVMRLNIDNTIASGDYRYSNKDDGMDLKGTLQNNTLSLNENYYDSKTGEYTTTGSFEGTLYPDKGAVKGTWFSADRSKSFPFEMKSYFGGTYPEYSFKSDIRGDEYSYTVTQLVVSDKQGNDIQLISDIDAHPTYKGITLEDVNFDGYQDIALMELLGARTASYLYWLYNPKTGLYELTDLFNEMNDPQFDYRNKTVTSSWTYGSSNYGSTEYQYENGRFNKIKEMQYQEDDDTGESEGTIVRYMVVNNESIEYTKEVDIIRLKPGSTDQYVTTTTHYKKVNDNWIEIE